MTEIERYSGPVRILHATVSVAFCALLFTGVILFPLTAAFGSLERWARMGHQIGAVLFVGTPLVYLLLCPRQAARGLRQAFRWSREDLHWVLAAPRYYFLVDEKAMPAQEFLNTGQKFWFLLLLMAAPVLLVTGVVMWEGSGEIPSDIFFGAVLLHDICFIVLSSMFLVHLYLVAVHPLTREGRGSMLRGTVSPQYAKTHHGKWYARVFPG